MPDSSQRIEQDIESLEKPTAMLETPTAVEALTGLDLDAILSQAEYAAIQANGREWDPCKPNTKLGECTVEVCDIEGIVHVRVQCTMNVSVGQIIEASRQRLGDPKGTTTELIRKIDKHREILRVQVEIPIVKDREFVVIRRICPECTDATAPSIVMVSLPKEHDEQLISTSKNKKLQRGSIVTQCMWLAEHHSNPNQTRVNWISAVKPGGLVPTAGKIAAKKSSEALVALEEAASLLVQ